jgi:hypothetical protein
MVMSPIGCVLGIDPGEKGGFALLSHDGIAQTWPMPDNEMEIGCLFRNRLSPAKVSHCIIERVHSMPKDGRASIFKFGRNAGVLIGMLIANEIAFEEMAPEIWQKALGIQSRWKKPKGRGLMINFPPEETKRQWKKRLMATARQLFPKAEVTLSTADALLIAEVARRMTTGYRGRPIL